MPNAESNANSTSRIRPGDSRPSSAGSTQRFGTVAICSHFAMQACDRPASPRRSRTCQAIARALVEHGTMITSFARRLRTSGERMTAGRRLSKETQWIAPRFNGRTVCAGGVVTRPRRPLREPPCPRRHSTPPRFAQLAARSSSRVPAPGRRATPAVRPRGAIALPRRCGTSPAHGFDRPASARDHSARTPSLAFWLAYALSYLSSYWQSLAQETRWFVSTPKPIVGRRRARSGVRRRRSPARPSSCRPDFPPPGRLALRSGGWTSRSPRAARTTPAGADSRSACPAARWCVRSAPPPGTA